MRSLTTNRSAILGSVAATISVGLLGLTLALQPARGAATISARQPTAPVRTGTEVVAVFLVSSTCSASQLAELPGSLARIHSQLRMRAQAEGKRYYTLGVATDEYPADGVKFLGRFGDFDEVMAGRGWFGTGAVTFMLRDVPGPMATPQLLIIERDIVVGMLPSASEDRVVTRRVGAAEISEYAQMLEESASAFRMSDH